MKISDNVFWTAATFDQAMGILLSPKNKQVLTIFHKNSLKFWRKEGGYDMQDAVAEMMSSLCHQYNKPDKHQEFLRMFNSGNEMNRWMVRYCKRHFGINKGIAFRKYYSNRYNDDNIHTPDLIDLPQEDSIKTEEKENDIRSYCGKDQLSMMIQILATKEAKGLFHPEQLDLFFHFFLSDPEHKVPLISDIAKQVGITRLAAYRLIMPVKKFLSKTMKNSDGIKCYLFRADEK